MRTVIVVKSEDPFLKEARETAARRLLAGFDAPPDARLLCFFDNNDWPGFKSGRATRGLYSPVDEHLWDSAPTYVREQIGTNAKSGLLTNAFEHFIYLHGSTCSSEISMTMTFAHELQHFLQEVRVPHLRRAGWLITNLSKDTIAELGWKWADVPHCAADASGAHPDLVFVLAPATAVVPVPRR